MTKNTPHTFKTHDPDQVYAAVKRLALSEAASGAKRISIRKLLETVRAQLRCDINNDIAPTLARKLIAERPELDKLIETRALNRRGKNTPTVSYTNPNLSVDAFGNVGIDPQLVTGTGLRITPSSGVSTVSIDTNTYATTDYVDQTVRAQLDAANTKIKELESDLLFLVGLMREAA